MGLLTPAEWLVSILASITIRLHYLHFPSQLTILHNYFLDFHELERDRYF